MNIDKNNFFVKFAYFYTFNVKKIAKRADNLWDAIEDDFLPGLVGILKNLIILIVRIIYLFLPLPQFVTVFRSKYLNVEEIERLTGQRRKQGSYFSKKSIKEAEKEIEEEIAKKARNE